MYNQTFANYRIAVPGIKSLASVFEKNFRRRVRYATVETPRGAGSASAHRSAAIEDGKRECQARFALDEALRLPLVVRRSLLVPAGARCADAQARGRRSGGKRKR